MKKPICLILTFILLLCCSSCKSLFGTVEEPEELKGYPVWESTSYGEYDRGEYYTYNGTKYYRYDSGDMTNWEEYRWLFVYYDSLEIVGKIPYGHILGPTTYKPVYFSQNDKDQNLMLAITIYDSLGVRAVREGFEIPKIETAKYSRIFLTDTSSEWPKVGDPVTEVFFEGDGIYLDDLLGEKQDREKFSDKEHEGYRVNCLLKEYEYFGYEINLCDFDGELYLYISLPHPEYEELCGYYTMKEEYVQAFKDAIEEYKKL